MIVLVASGHIIPFFSFAIYSCLWYFVVQVLCTYSSLSVLSKIICINMCGYDDDDYVKRSIDVESRRAYS